MNEQRPTLVQRQDALVAKLQPIHAKYIALGNGGGGAYAGERAKAKRGHIEEMVAAGYTKREAAESAQQCDDVAYRNADYEALEAQLSGSKAGAA